MLRNYIKIAWRNLVRYRFYSIVNITGLCTGIVFTLLIGSYVWGELHVNRTLRNSERQYFLKSIWRDPNQGVEITTLGPLSKRLKESYPNLVANYYRWDGITSVVSKGDKHFREGIQLGDSTFLQMFGFELLHGDAKTALNDPSSIVITSDLAIKYFGRSDVVGQTLNIQSFSGGKKDFLITGVLKDLPENSVTELNAANHNKIFIPTAAYTYFGRGDFENWGNTIIPSYVELKPGVNAKDLSRPIRQLIDQNAPVFIKPDLHVQPVRLSEYYMHKENSVASRMVWTLSFVAFFIMLMAIVNFVNISIGSSSARMKEIGVRKVLGGRKKQLIMQFLTESTILVSVATMIAFVLYPMAQPLFEKMVGKEIPSLNAFPGYYIFIPIVIAFLIGITSGMYPAFILSSMKTLDSLKGKLRTVKENAYLRKGLVGFQFCLALVILVMATVVTQQVNFFFSKSLGYNKEWVVSSQAPRDWTPAGVRHMETIRQEFASMPQVEKATLSFEIPNGMNGGQPPIFRAGQDSTLAIASQALQTDEFYLDTYQIPLKAGSFFSHGASDSNNVVINETAAKALGWKDAASAVGQLIRIPGAPPNFTVEGVTTDFHFNSMGQAVQPMIFFHVVPSVTYRYLSFRIKPGNVAGAIAAIEKKWAQLMPGSSFEYNFMDKTLEQLYASELQFKSAAYVSTFLSLIIVLLGTLGLVSLSIHKRVKEVGVRKVLGASANSIMMLFIKDFALVMLIAGLVACPIGWMVSKQWLNNYFYRINISALPFILSLAVIALLTVLLIVLQTMRAARANPVKSLRTE